MKVLQHYIRQIANEPGLVEGVEDSPPIPEVQERFALRGAAGQVADGLIDILEAEWGDKELTSASLYMFVDGSETSFSFNNDEFEPNIVLIGDYADALPDIAFDIVISPSDKFDIDGDYIHDGGDIDDPGEIEIKMSVPNTLLRFQEVLSTVRQQLRGTIAHEMQHSVQKLIYGMPPPQSQS